MSHFQDELMYEWLINRQCINDNLKSFLIS